MKKSYWIIFMTTAILLAACGMNENNLQVKTAGAEIPFKQTSSGTYTSTKTFSFSKDGQTTTTKSAAHHFALANYELDTSSGMISLDKALTTPEQVRINFQITGEEGTDDKTPIKSGTYTASADKFNKIDLIRIVTFADGKETKTSFRIDKTEGEIKINSVNGESVSGEINLTEGDKSVKGAFTAKITVRK